MSLIRVRDKEGNYIDIPALQGESAYDIAVRNGFVGTEQEWLESMGFANYVVLNKLGDSNGNLTYDGKVVGGRQTATVTLDAGEATIDSPIASSTNIFLNNTNKVPENAEIVSVELNNGTIDVPDWIDLRDMLALYPTFPYSLLYHKLKCSNAFSNSYLLATIIFVSEKNELISALGLLQVPQIRVTYYI